MVTRLVVVQVYAGSSPVYHPKGKYAALAMHAGGMAIRRRAVER